MTTLKKELSQELDRLAPGPAQLSLDTGKGHLEVSLSSIDTLACAAESIRLASNRLAKKSVAELKKISDELSQRLTYLMEPISLTEVDGDQCVVQLRSNPPQRDDDGATYYELLVARAGIQLFRFHAPPGQSRQQIPAQLTREVLSRLAGDFVAALP